MQVKSIAVSPSRPRSRARIPCFVIFALALADGAGAAERIELAQLPIEQLLNLEVSSASRFVQKVSEAPSAVTVVTAAEIKTFGWRTLADILRSINGLYVNNDRNYSYLGARGFLRPGDYNTRFLLLLDGNRTNDTVYDQASIGSEFVLDVDLIERVEFVPGPGSSIYGANALFGVINVISKRGRDFNGPQASVEAGSFGARKARASYGWRGDNGAELLLSATGFRTDGQDLFFREFNTPENNNGVARSLDYDRGQSFLAKAALGPLALSLAHAERTKGIPTASFSQVFNDPRAQTVDTQTYADLSYRGALSDQTELSARAFAGRYDYRGDYVYDGAPLTVLNRDGSKARWWGADFKLVDTRFARHKLVSGLEYQHDAQRDQYNFDRAPYLNRLDDRRSGDRFGVYLQDEITLRDDLLLNAGVRYDRHSASGDAFNPRLALIYKATPATTVKALYGSAFRAPNAFEQYYQIDAVGGQKANPDLKAERIRTRELVLEHQIAPDCRIGASMFHNTVSDLITQMLDPADGLLVYQNIDKALAQGVELTFEKVWSGGAKLRAGASWQRTEDAASGALLANSPQRLAKLNLSLPLLRGAWRAGLEAQYVGPRTTLQSRIGGYWLANATLFSARLAPGLELSAGLYNLFDHRYADPGGEEHVQDALQQDGRSVRLKLTYGF